MRALLVCLIALSPSAASAAAGSQACGPRVTVTYHDSAPDLFVIRNLSAVGWTLVEATIDLAGSRGDLIFDTDQGGQGAGSPEPFSGVAGAPVRLTGASPLHDGGRAVALCFEGFAAGSQYTFLVDVDDRLTNSVFGQAHVDGSEMAGSRATARLIGPTGRTVELKAVFAENAVADTGAGGCV